MTESDRTSEPRFTLDEVRRVVALLLEPAESDVTVALRRIGALVPFSEAHVSFPGGETPIVVGPSIARLATAVEGHVERCARRIVLGSELGARAVPWPWTGGAVVVATLELRPDQRARVLLARDATLPPFAARELALLEVLAPALQASVERARSLARSDEGFGLARRERQVAALATRGLSDREIARSLGIKFGSVRTYLRRAFAKTGASNRTQLGFRLRHADAG